MNFKKLFFSKILFLALIGLTFTACDNDDGDDSLDGEVEFEMTDAPIDDPNVEAVFVTVADIRVNGQSWEGFDGKTTINLLAYQNGNTTSLGSGEIATGSYSDVTLILDNETDENGNSPGSYVMTKNGQKEALGSNNMNELDIDGSFTATSNDKKNVVIDFDLRKAITYESGASNEYQFVTNSELNSSIRLIAKENSGRIQGDVEDNITASEKIVVYAYRKGTYNRDTEMNGQGASNIQFKNAVTSSVVADDGSYTLAFLESGDYELKFVSYTDTDNDGKLDINGSLILDIVGGADLNTVSVTAGATLTLNVVVTGVLPI